MPRLRWFSPRQLFDPAGLRPAAAVGGRRSYCPPRRRWQQPRFEGSRRCSLARGPDLTETASSSMYQKTVSPMWANAIAARGVTLGEVREAISPVRSDEDFEFLGRGLSACPLRSSPTQILQLPSVIFPGSEQRADASGVRDDVTDGRDAGEPGVCRHERLGTCRTGRCGKDRVEGPKARSFLV
jgi:hypothetical protein